MTKRRILLKIEIFALIFAVLLSSVTFVMRNKKQTKLIASFYDEPKKSLDVVFLGTSHMLNAISPLQLYNDYGICSYNYSSDSVPLLLSYNALKSITKYQNFKIACIDLLGIQYTTENSYRAWNDLYPWFHFLVDEIPIFLDKTILINQYLSERKDNFSIHLESNIPIYRFHSRWTSLQKERDFIQFNDFQKGYSPNFKTCNVSSPLIIPKEERLRLYTRQSSTIRNIIDFCNLNGIKLIFTVIPYGQKYGTNKLLKQYNEISFILKNEKNVDYINYFHCLDKLKLDFSIDFADESHVNPIGAQKITAHLGKYIKEHYDIPDRRLDPAYAKWNDDYKLYVQDTFAQELNATRDSEKYVQLIASKKEAADNTCMFVVKMSGGGVKIVNIFKHWD